MASTDPTDTAEGNPQESGDGKTGEVTIRILSDDPTGEDAFGSHSRIANALADMIKREPGGKTIALEGCWGSGKSSVMHMVESKLGETTKVFQFDAWSHEGDPLRRSFLERLVDSLSGWIDDGKWSKRKKEWASREQTIKTFSTPTLTTKGNWAALSVLLVPVGIGLLSTTETWNTSAGLTGLALTGAPIVVGSLAWLLARLAHWHSTPSAFGSRREDGPESATKKKASRKGNMLALFLNHVDHTVESETFQTAEPTSVEFEEYFKELLSEAISGDKRRLVIVIENIDRIDPEETLSIWSTFQAFFHLVGKEDWEQNLWVVVPFASEAIEPLWGSEAGNGVVRSFKDKTFQVVVRVPPVVQEDWASFFEKQFKLAFKGYSKDTEIHAVYRVFRQKVFPSLLQPTPRDIKRFINQLGSLYRQWGDEIPLRIQALFVALSRSGDFPISDLVNATGGLPHLLPPDFLGADFRKYLAALYFNVPADKSLHMLLVPELETCLKELDVERFTELHSIKGFSKILENHIDSASLGSLEHRPQELAEIAYMLDQIGESTDRSWLRSWECVGESVAKVSSWDTLPLESAKGLAALIRRNGKGELPKAICESLSRSEALFSQINVESTMETKLEAVASAITVVVKAIHDIDSADTILSNLNLPCTASNHLQVLLNMVENDVDSSVLGLVRCKEGSDALVKAISGDVQKSQYTMNHREIVRGMLSAEGEWPLESLIADMVTIVQQGKPTEPAEITPLLLSILDLGVRDSRGDTVLQGMAQSGAVHDLLHNAESDVEATAMCLLILIVYNPSGGMTSVIRNSATGKAFYGVFLGGLDKYDNVVSRLTTLVIQYDYVERMVDNAAKHDELEPLLASFVGSIVDRPDGTVLLSSELIKKYPLILYRALGTGRDAFVERLVAETSIVADLMADEFNPWLSFLYQLVYQADPADSTVYLDYLKTGLKSIDEDTWLSNLNDTHLSEWDLAEALLEDGVVLGLDIDFMRALTKHIEESLSDQGLLARLQKRLLDLLKACNESSRNTMLRDFRDNIITSEEPCADMMSLFTAEILGCAILQDDNERLIRTGFGNILDRGDEAEYDWVIQVLDRCRDLRKGIDDTTKHFKSRILRELREVNAETSEELIDRLKSIAELLGVPVPTDQDDSPAE